MRRLAVLSVVVAGCHYHPTTYRDLGGNWPGTHVELPCVDLAVGPVHDAGADDPIVAYSFGNRCEHRVAIDLASVRVVGRDADGRELELHAHDPGHELRALALPARFSGSERIQYEPLTQVAQLCIDVGRVEAEAPIGERWVCFGGGPR